MRNILLFILTLSTFSCATSKSKNINKKYDQRYEVVQIPIVADNETSLIHELRFYKINSAKNTGKAMFDQFGKWNRMLEGKHQENITQLVWENMELLNNKTLFTVITDGTETQTDFFSSVIVFDSNNQDCLSPSHPFSELLIDFFAMGINNLSDDRTFYRL